MGILKKKPRSLPQGDGSVFFNDRLALLAQQPVKRIKMAIAAVSRRVMRPVPRNEFRRECQRFTLREQL